MEDVLKIANKMGGASNNATQEDSMDRVVMFL